MQFDEFLSVVDLLKDTSKYEAKIAELQSREQAITEATKQLGLASDIVKAKKQADTLSARAQTILESAEIEAKALIEGAQKAFDKKFQELQAKEVVADQALANYNTIKSQLAAREDALRSSEKEIDSLRATLEKQLTELSSKQVEVDERLFKLRQVMG